MYFVSNANHNPVGLAIQLLFLGLLLYMAVGTGGGGQSPQYFANPKN